jgi:hypothetical protein
MMKYGTQQRPNGYGPIILAIGECWSKNKISYLKGCVTLTLLLMCMKLEGKYEASVTQVFLPVLSFQFIFLVAMVHQSVSTWKFYK